MLFVKIAQQIKGGAFKLKKAGERKLKQLPRKEPENNSMLEMMMLQAKMKQRREAIRRDDADSSDEEF